MRDPQGNYVAEVKDLVIDPATGPVSHVVLTDIPGMGAEDVAVPFDTVSKTGAAIFVYNAPENVYPFSGETAYRSEGFYLYAHESMPVGSYNASKSFGATARTSGGEDVGRIDDFVIDSQDGHIVYVVLSNVGGMEDKFVAVPFNALSESGEYTFVLNTTREEVLAAPAFTWPDMNNRKYAEDVYRYYGQQLYWE